MKFKFPVVSWTLQYTHTLGQLTCLSKSAIVSCNRVCSSNSLSISFLNNISLPSCSFMGCSLDLALKSVVSKA